MGYFFSLFFGTFILEDLALISSLAFVSEKKISFLAAFWACFLGITIGDLGLYFLGYLSSQFKFEKRFHFFKKHQSTFIKMRNSKVLTYSILISRVIPGTRLVTYLGAGFLKYPAWSFLLLTLSSVFVWVFGALLAGQTLHAVFRDHWLISLLLFVFVLRFVKKLVPILSQKWDRKALFHSFRKWQHFEFWPAWFFYIPIVPYYIYLSIKYKSFLIPFYANPLIKNGGLIGESKWDFLKYLNPKDSSTLQSIKCSHKLGFFEVKSILEKENMNYPFVIKPDVGQRGFGVRIIHNDYDLTEYLLMSPFDRILQTLSLLPREAGLFYVRQPSDNIGSLFSITDKYFPFLVGDGVHPLGDLILKDSRARIIASVYFARLGSQLDMIPKNNETIFLSECGNHCQGAIFKNGASLITRELTLKVDKIVKEIPEFYFGRLDVRYQDQDSLMNGEKFQIVEINGAGSEATHIWDKETKLVEAYQTLFKQWALIFKIGYEIKKKYPHNSNIQVIEFLKESFLVLIRKRNLSVSS